MESRLACSNHNHGSSQPATSYLRDYDRRHGWRGVARPGSLEGRKNLISIYPAKVIKVANQLECRLIWRNRNHRLWYELDRYYDRLTIVGVDYSNAHRMIKVGNIVANLSDAMTAKQFGVWNPIPKVQSALVSLDPENGALRADLLVVSSLITFNLIVLYPRL